MKYDYKNLSKKRINDLENAFASSALEGQDNPKVNQYIIDQIAKGLSQEQRIEEAVKTLKANPKKFLSQFI